MTSLTYSTNSKIIEMQEQLDLFIESELIKIDAEKLRQIVRQSVNRYSEQHPFPIVPFNSVKIDEFAECLYNELKTTTTLCR